jgi:hypothetical protein
LVEALVEGVAIAEAGEGIAVRDVEKVLVGAIEIIDKDVVVEVMEIAEALVAVEGVVGDDGDGGGTDDEEDAKDFFVGVEEDVVTEEDKISEDHDGGDGEGVGEAQPHGDIGEEDDGEDAEWSIGRCHGRDVALDEEMSEAGEASDESDTGLAEEPGRMKEHADVNAESEGSDDAGADQEGLPEMSWATEVVCDEEEIEEDD